jgi:hypothetical protein
VQTSHLGGASQFLIRSGLVDHSPDTLKREQQTNPCGIARESRYHS